MNEHDHAPEHAFAAPRARRDLLGLSALLGPDSHLVPISDYDGGETCSSTTTPAAQATGTDEPAVCGGCTTRCASHSIQLEQVSTCASERRIP